MPLPHVQLLLPDGRQVVLYPEDIIGRMSRADLRICDPRISEAHAMVSLRGRSLRLIALAGKVVSDREPGDRVTLAPGVRIRLAAGYTLEVEEVVVPDTWHSLHLPGLPPTPLLHSVYSLWRAPRLEVGHREGADAWIWRSGEVWVARDAGGVDLTLAPGPVQIGGLLGELVAERAEGAESTALASTAPRRFLLRYDAVEVEQGGRRLPGGLSGNPARIFCELALYPQGYRWDEVAAQVWPEVARERRERERAQGRREDSGLDDDALRQVFDRAIGRLRGNLSRLGIERELVSSSGGIWRLVLREGDELVDLTGGV